jgi:hypothetical protein
MTTAGSGAAQTRTRRPRYVVQLVLNGQQRATIVFGNSQYSSAAQQKSLPMPLPQTRLPAQQTPPWQTSPAKHPPPQDRFSATHAGPFGVLAQTCPSAQQAPLQQAAIGQQTPPQTIAASQPSQQQAPLTQTWFG